MHKIELCDDAKWQLRMQSDDAKWERSPDCPAPLVENVRFRMLWKPLNKKVETDVCTMHNIQCSQMCKCESESKHHGARRLQKNVHISIENVWEQSRI